MFSDATGTDMLELYPQASEELPIMFRDLNEFELIDDNVTLGKDFIDDMSDLK